MFKALIGRFYPKPAPVVADIACKIVKFDTPRGTLTWVLPPEISAVLDLVPLEAQEVALRDFGNSVESACLSLLLGFRLATQHMNP